jgi:proline racemase
MAVRPARGEVAPGDKLTARSIIGSRCDAELLGATTVAGRPATLTRISGRAWIHGLHRVGLDPADPWPRGYLLSDTWGDAFDLMS